MMRTAASLLLLCLLAPHTFAQDRPRIDELIELLDSSDWKTRTQATEALVRLGEQAVPALRKALETHKSLELRSRVRRLLARFTILDDLGSSDARVRASAIERLSARRWPERLALFRRGLWHANERTARACAWALDFDYLDVREIERKVAVLTPYLRQMDQEPVRGLRELTKAETGLEQYRRHFNFDHAGRVLARFPEKPRKSDYPPDVLFSQIHRRFSGEHVPQLVALCRRSAASEPDLAAQAFSTALGVSTQTGMHIDQVVPLVLQYDPCVRHHAKGHKLALRPRNEPGRLPARKGLPAEFIAVLERCYFCPHCRKTSKHTWAGEWLAVWGRTLTPAQGDIPTLIRLTGDGEVASLQIWAARQLGRLDNAESKRRLTRLLGEGRPDELQCQAAHSLARLGQSSGVDFLRTHAPTLELALLMLHDVAPDDFARLLPRHLAMLRPEKVADFLVDARTASLAYQLRLPESALHPIGDWMLAECRDPAALCELFRRASGGPRRKAALAALDLAVKARKWPLSSSQTGFLEVWARKELEQTLNRRSAAGDPVATVMLRRRSGIREQPKASPAQLERWRSQRHLGQYWRALEMQTRAGDPAATGTYMAMIRKGYYELWSNTSLEELPWKLNDVPRVMQWADATCCTRVDIESIWEGLFGEGAVKPVFDECYRSATQRARLTQHWTIHRGTMVYSKIARHYITGPPRR